MESHLLLTHYTLDLRIHFARAYLNIMSTDVAPFEGQCSRVCPRAIPKLPPELLPQVEKRFKSLRLVSQTKPILWVGLQAKPETLCMHTSLGQPGCDCFDPELPDAISRPTTADGEHAHDPLEDALSGQSLQLYQFLKPRKYYTSFDTLGQQSSFLEKAAPNE